MLTFRAPRGTRGKLSTEESDWQIRPGSRLKDLKMMTRMTTMMVSAMTLVNEDDDNYKLWWEMILVGLGYLEGELFSRERIKSGSPNKPTSVTTMTTLMKSNSLLRTFYLGTEVAASILRPKLVIGCGDIIYWLDPWRQLLARERSEQQEKIGRLHFVSFQINIFKNGSNIIFGLYIVLCIWIIHWIGWSYPA